LRARANRGSPKFINKKKKKKQTTHTTNKKKKLESCFGWEPGLVGPHALWGGGGDANITKKRTIEERIQNFQPNRRGNQLKMRAGQSEKLEQKKMEDQQRAKSDEEFFPDGAHKKLWGE